MPLLSHNINFAHWRAEDLHPETFATGEFTFHSPALQSLGRLLTMQPKACVLDFGPLHRENIEFLSSFHCKIFVEDFHESAPLPESLPAEKLDAVLCWDMFNYLEGGAAKLLVQGLTARMRIGGMVMLYSGSRSFVPKEPLQFRIIGTDQIRCMSGSAASEKRNPITPRALQELMHGWRLVRSLHLRSSLQEHLFMFEGGAN